MQTRNFLAAAAAGLVCARAAAAAPVAAADPWAQVPALPTACYSSQDGWWDKISAALDVVQQAMMEDPQNAQKMLEQMMQQGQQAQAELPERMEREQQLEAESKSVMKQYDAALARAMAPAEARWSALRNKLSPPKDANHPGESGVPDWAWAEWHVIQRERDEVYVGNCAQWWSAAGPIHAYLKRYRDFLVQERTPYYQKMTDEPRLRQYEMEGVSAEGYRTTIDYEAAEKYMERARVMFDRRETDPRCTNAARCRLDR